MKTTTLKLFFLLYAFGTSKAQLPAGAGDSTYYILPNGAQNKYYYQRDVAVFRYNGGTAFIDTLPSFVDSICWIGNEWHGYNQIFFDTAAPHAQCMAYWYYMNGYPGFEYGFIPVTKDKNATWKENKWCMGSDLINVRFPRTPISNLELSAFIARNNLKLFHRPDAGLPNADSWVWVFQLQGEDRFLPLPACARIFANESGYITMCEPDLQIFRPAGTSYSCNSLPSEFSDWAGTSYPNALWHINNQGGVVVPGIGSGTPGADAKICGCWAQGYDGSGVQVAVIDNGNIWDFNHPNLTGNILSGYNFSMNQPLSSSYNGGGTTHGMEVASVIVGIPDGGQTPLQAHNTTGVGVAYGAKVRPYIVTLGTSNVALAIQQAVLDGCWVVNMSFGGLDTSFNQSSVYTTILQSVQLSRWGLGVVFVSSVGNDNGDEVTWPAAMVDVIGVGATDANDYRGSINAYDGPWDWLNIGGGGSNFHDLNLSEPTLHYDVVAPGTCIHTDFTDFSSSPSLPTSWVTTGTSLAAPVVAGIAAMMLQQNGLYSYNDVINSLTENADKINAAGGGIGGPGTAYPYDYHQYSTFLDGYDKEMFFGRVNCAKTLANPIVGMKEQSKKSTGVKLAYVNEREAMLIFNPGANDEGSFLTIFDISGRQMSVQKIESGKLKFSVNTEFLANGVYLLRVADTNNLVETFKYIK